MSFPFILWGTIGSFFTGFGFCSDWRWEWELINTQNTLFYSYSYHINGLVRHFCKRMQCIFCLSFMAIFIVKSHYFWPFVTIFCTVIFTNIHVALQQYHFLSRQKIVGAIYIIFSRYFGLHQHIWLYSPMLNYIWSLTTCRVEFHLEQSIY